MLVDVGVDKERDVSWGDENGIDRNQLHEGLVTMGY